jgi:hypothetical protein
MIRNLTGDAGDTADARRRIGLVLVRLRIESGGWLRRGSQGQQRIAEQSRQRDGRRQTKKSRVSAHHTNPNFVGLDKLKRHDIRTMSPSWRTMDPANDRDTTQV